MDVSRAVLDNLMGRDRNKSLDNITERDHYSNPDVHFCCHKRSANRFWSVFVSIPYSPTPPTIRVRAKSVTIPT